MISKQIVLTYSVIHFVVDFACMALVASLAQRHHTSLFGAVIAYNFFAFFVQMPLGIIADRVNKNALLAASGCVLVMAAFLCVNWPFYACIIAGIGNALFHLGGGIDVLNISCKRAAQAGIFVSTGALGLFFGKNMGSQLPVVAILLALSACLLVFLYVRIRGKVSNLPVQFPSLTGGKWIVAGCLIATVCLRSYVGFLTIFTWKTNYWLALLAVCAIVLGKMLGGIVGDRLGFVRTAAVSLSVAAIAFLFAFDCPAAGIMALICFNMTMPLTLIVLANLMPHNKGFAFGILTAALFVGGLPGLCGFQALATPVGLCLLSVLSACLLVPALSQGKKYDC